MANIFSPTLFLVLLRETLEVGIVISVLLSFISRLDAPDQSVAHRMRKMVWLGALLSAVIVVGVGSALIAVWYIYGTNLYQNAEKLYGAIFGLVASVFVACTGLAFCNGQGLYQVFSANKHIQYKLETKLNEQSQTSDSTVNLPETFQLFAPSEVIVLKEDKVSKPDSAGHYYASQVFFWVPFLTVLREGIETVLMIGGVAIGQMSSTIPLSVITGIFLGCVIGYAIHRAAGKLSLRLFFTVISFILLLMAAGIFSRSVGMLEDYSWAKAINMQSDDTRNIAFDPRSNIWFLPNSSEIIESGYGFAYSFFGYRAVATIWTITSYCLFWIAICGSLVIMKLQRRNKNRARFQ